MHLLPYIIFTVLQLSSEGRAYSIPSDKETLSSKIERKLQARDENTAWAYDNGTPVGENYWTHAKTPEDIEVFRARYNLTLVDRIPQDAALMPSWPQALVQFILISPPFHTGVTVTENVNGKPKYHQAITPYNAPQLVLSPVLFVAWLAAFVMAQVKKQAGGWVSFLGWAMWYDLKLWTNYWTIIPIAIQWPLSLVLIFQRQYGSLGTVAYQITDLNGCTPYQGVDYLQYGARSNMFRWMTGTTFGMGTFFALVAMGSWHKLAPWMAIPALGELIMTSVFASQGTPIVASGDCLLVELKPSLGFLDSEISTKWKVFATMMGF